MTTKREHRFNVGPCELILDTENLTLYKAGGANPGVTDLQVAEFHPSPSKISEIFFNITDNCNLKCKYCYLSYSEGRRNMSTETIEKALKLFSSTMELATQVRIQFFGGEPLLNFEGMKKVVEVSRNIMKKNHVLFGVFTNGSHLSPEIEDFLVENNFEIQISLDGPPEIHNNARPFKNGRQSYETISTNALRLLELMPNNVRIGATINPDEIDIGFARRYEHLLGMGFRLVSINLCHGVPHPGVYISEKHSETLLKDLELAAIRYIERIENFQFEGIFEFNKILTIMEAKKKVRYPWFGGIEPVVCSNGDIYPWIWLINFEQYHIGNVYSGVDVKRLMKIIEKTCVEEITVCKNCWARYLCGGCNYIWSVHFEKGLIEPLAPICDVERRKIELGLFIYYHFSGRSPEIIKLVSNYREIGRKIVDLV